MIMRDSLLLNLELIKSDRLAVIKAQNLTFSPCLEVGLQPYNPQNISVLVIQT